MEEFKLHSKGAGQHSKSIKDVFETFKKRLKNDTTLSNIEKKNQLKKAKETYLKERKSLKSKLF